MSVEEAELQIVKGRLDRLEAEVFGRGTLDRDVRRQAALHLDRGDLDRAGSLLKIDRAHGGGEDDESYGRRLIAEVHGVDAADARNARPRTTDGGDDPTQGDDVGDDGADQDPNAAPVPVADPAGPITEAPLTDPAAAPPQQASDGNA